jgi:beta-lactamase class A
VRTLGRHRTLAIALAVAVAIAAAIAIAATPGAAVAGGERAGEQAAKKGDGEHPWRKRVRSAERYARSRTGRVSFAIVDEGGRVRGDRGGARYSSASLVKTMLLVAYLRTARGRGLDDSERALLGPMIRVSDNDAADQIMGRVGADGLARLARRARMRRFSPSEAWGGSQVTARDQARFFDRLRRLLPDRHRAYGLELLATVADSQRWGIPPAAPKRWRVHFKGGWFPGDGGWRVHQAALMRRGDRELALAVLTEGGPSLGYGAATIRGIARRLLRGYER